MTYATPGCQPSLDRPSTETQDGYRCLGYRFMTIRLSFLPKTMTKKWLTFGGGFRYDRGP